MKQLYRFILVMCASCLMVPTALGAQNRQRVTLDLRQATVEEAVLRIQQATNYGVVFREGTLPTTRRDFSFRNATIEQAMNEIVDGTNLDWSSSNSIVTLTPAPQTPQTPQATRRTVTGVVTDFAGNTIPGVSVSLQGATGVGTSTDAQGKYSITVARGASLEFSYVGMVTRVIAVADQQTLNVTMEEEAFETGTVVVTGVFDKPRESYTGAATQFTATQLRDAGGGSLVSALRNLDPSFYVAENILDGSNPNTMPTVTMRGATALPSSIPGNLADMAETNQTMAAANRPIVVLNGFEVPFTRLIDIDESTVENITLLKDASATSLYGTRGSNGVIVISTKRPEPGRLQVTYRGGVSIEAPDLSSYNLMNAKEKLEYEQLAGLYTSAAGAYAADVEQLLNDRLLDVARGVDTDWLHYPVRVGVGHSHSLFVEGGEETFRYALNAGYRNTEGAMKGSGRETFNAGMNFIYNMEDLSFQNDLQVSTTASKNSPYGTFSTYATINPYLKPYDDDGNLLKNLDEYMYKYSSRFPESDVANPLYDAIQPQKDTGNDFQLRNNLSVEWHINPDLFVRGQMGITLDRNRTDSFRSSTMLMFEGADFQGDNAKYKGKYDLGWTQNNVVDGELTLNYNKTLNDVHQLFVGAGGRFRNSKSEQYYATGYGIAVKDMDFYGSAKFFRENQTPYGNDAVTRSMDVFANVNYTYDNRYFVDASLNYSGSSIFGENNRFMPIWSLGAGWNIHREKWFSSDLFDYARVRGSYGVTGSQNFQPYLSQVMFNTTDVTYDLWGGSNMMGIGNPDLRASTTTGWNIGGEVALLNNRFTLNVDVYNRVTDNQITQIDLPLSAGFAAYSGNLGKVQNKGVEVMFNAVVLRNPDRRFSWSVGGMMGHNKNSIKEISESLKTMNDKIVQAYNDNLSDGNRQMMSNPAFKYQEGQSIHTLYVVKSLGIDPMTGREILLNNINGDTPYFGDQWNAQTMVPVGSQDPDMSGNVNTVLRYQGWKLSAYFNYSVGGVAYNQALVDRVEVSQPWLNADKRALTERWKEPGDKTYYKAINDLSFTRATSRFVMKNNYLQLSQLSVSYEFNREWCKRNLGMQFFEVTAETSDVFHLATIKRERGTSYPFARTFSLSLNARF